jgi:hypothetical protein
MTLDDRIAAILAISAAERRAEWTRMFGNPAPPAFGAGLLARALAYRLQEKQFGGLTASEQRLLLQIGRKEKRERARGTITTTVKPGTWLSRTWHGEVHQVVVLETGFDYRGQRYASLTAIARTITGANWSGPRFFGLHSPRLERMGVSADG